MQATSLSSYSVTVEELKELDVALPRYTSYPTAPHWPELPAQAPSIYADHLAALDTQPRPLSLYFHIPFCKTMCLYCGCSVVLNRRDDVQEKYVDDLLQEIALVKSYLTKKHEAAQIHLGGGTPTQLTPSQLERLFYGIKKSFPLQEGAEVSIEIDPRTVYSDRGEKLRFLQQMGFNRVSFGVQDTNSQVQEAVRRRQSAAVSEATFFWAKELFKGVNVDLIYGLPHQSRATFEKTVETILSWGPDRVALFSYAKVPWIKPHQKAIREKDLPSLDEKLSIYARAREQFLQAGYVAIGMDHFAKPCDDIAKALPKKALQRNFQGYSLKLADDLLGFGITSTGFCREAYFQNIKEIESYSAALARAQLPTLKAKVLSLDDKKRKWAIHTLMCTYEIDKLQYGREFGADFDVDFASERVHFEALQAKGLVQVGREKMWATEKGKLFIRNVASVFDSYLKQKEGHKLFSRSI
jgi:oxygen-independent coproporphyrinogen-3 oxidase